MQPPRPPVSSFPNLLEAFAFSAVILLYIWRWQSAPLRTWLIFPAWLLLSFVLRRDTPKTLGWRADNLKAAAQLAVPVFAVFIAAIILAGIALGGLHRLPVHLIEPRRFIGYFAFCLLQQVALQSLTMNRLLRAFSNPNLAALIGGLLFAALHWPNPVLVPLTLIGGTAMCWLFSRQRNILPLVLGQAILGALVFWAFPIAWHHSMRVGPGYDSFHL
jgi:CAAX prenyl protease-like protein